MKIRKNILITVINDDGRNMTISISSIGITFTEKIKNPLPNVSSVKIKREIYLHDVFKNLDSQFKEWKEKKSKQEGYD